jgi:hypothetical protein
MLDLLEVPLRKADFGFRRLDGTMTVAARERAIADFESSCDVMALIVVSGSCCWHFAVAGFMVLHGNCDHCKYVTSWRTLWPVNQVEVLLRRMIMFVVLLLLRAHCLLDFELCCDVVALIVLSRGDRVCLCLFVCCCGYEFCTVLDHQSGGFWRLDSTMTVAARERAIADFESSCDVMALIVVSRERRL